MPPRKQSLGADRPDQRAAGAETLRAVDLADLIEAERADVLSASLDVDPSRPEHQGQNPAYRTWLRTAPRPTLAAVPKEAPRRAGRGPRTPPPPYRLPRPHGEGGRGSAGCGHERLALKGGAAAELHRAG